LAVTQREIKSLYRRFRRIDKSNSGVISTPEFLAIPELALNPLVLRVVGQFDESGEDLVNFREFCRTLSVFSPNAPASEKMKFVFGVYDTDATGVVTNDDMFNVLHLMVGSNINDEQLKRIVDQTMDEVSGVPGSQEITYQQFERAFSDQDWRKLLSVRF